VLELTVKFDPTATPMALTVVIPVEIDIGVTVTLLVVFDTRSWVSVIDELTVVFPITTTLLPTVVFPTTTDVLTIADELNVALPL
jgi:hypothetical protein